MNIYLTDGSETCFYTAAFRACTDRTCQVTCENNVQLSLGAQIITVLPDEEKSARVRKKLQECDPRSLQDISLILRRGCPQKEMIALAYLRLIVRSGAPVRDRLSLSAVRDAADAIKKVLNEAHRLTGFLRFMESASGIFYAPFSPDNDILDLILPHFLRRFADQSFVIHDIARKKAALYNRNECIITPTDESVNVILSDREEGFQMLWKEYYRSVNIAQRPHKKQMKGYMPVRYWKFLPEKQPPE